MTERRTPELFLGESAVHPEDPDGRGDLVDREGERFYRIAGYHTLPPFLMSVVSAFDHWLFISSTGGLTCGRRDPENALFPYTTDDKLHDACETTGPVTLLRVARNGRTLLWRPFDTGPAVYDMERNLYKSVIGHKLVFEEINRDLGLAFSYAWASGERLGFIRTCRLVNLEEGEARLELLDGLRNLLPHGVDRIAQAEFSTLVDAYKQAETVPGMCAGIYTLSSIPTDRAEPSESLKATVVWSTGLERPRVLLSEDALRAFRAGRPVGPGPDGRGRRGAFLVRSAAVLPPRSGMRWDVMADVEQGPCQVAELLGRIRQGVTEGDIEADVAAGADRLEGLCGAADGFQKSGDELVTVRHFSNALFNIMRGGVFPSGYRFPRDHFLDFVGRWNRPLRAVVAAALERVEDPLTLESARRLAADSGDPDVARLVHEYLPLAFSRRHGDPSRPWNHFSIGPGRGQGAEAPSYQGNWRDIFQNWEALALSFPGYIESFIAKFVNASTADGYNPYRLSRDGFDWEAPDNGNSWANIGYWGDHQVCYLHRLLDLSRRYHPGRLVGWLTRDIFVHADVPYRIRPYREILRDPRRSVDYDHERARAVAGRVAEIGSDGKLVVLADGSLQRVNLMEKLLIAALVRVANLVPGGGIWMNTQRPEWNDANNALVGHGLSMVTLCYLRRFLELLRDLLRDSSEPGYRVSRELAGLFRRVDDVLRDHRDMLQTPVDPAARRSFMEAMGEAGDHYRGQVYRSLSGDREMMAAEDLAAFVERAVAFLDHTLAAARRPDGLFHSYSLIHFGPDGHDVEPLDEMLEGQVAVLSSGFLDGPSALELLAALRSSRLYRQDRNSYMLYPERRLPSFLDKNVIPPALVEGSPWMRQELASGRTGYIERDVDGKVHFSGAFRNGAELRAALDRDPALTDEEADRLCDAYEAVFRHRHFTGRSGTMYKYEGLGCIYWHMVSKLLLAIGETIGRAVRNGAERPLVEALGARFREIKDGLGVHTSPAEYGAFPTDPYSHTPAFGGVQQPGLTGQVKEDVITRFLELGVGVDRGEISFEPVLLGRNELLREPARWRYSTGGPREEEALAPGSLAFTLCGAPVIYREADTARIRILDDEGRWIAREGTGLGPELSQSLFRREGRIRKILVDLPGDALG